MNTKRCALNIRTLTKMLVTILIWVLITQWVVHQTDAVVSRAVNDCPEHCSNFDSFEMPGRLVLFSGYGLFWDDARRKCRQYHGQLLNIRNKLDNQIVFDYLKGAMFQEIKDADEDFVNVWLGATDKWNGEFKWLPDKTPLNFTSWVHGEPDQKSSAEERCVELNYINVYGLFWNHDSCAKAKRFMCEVETDISLLDVLKFHSTSFDILR